METLNLDARVHDLEFGSEQSFTVYDWRFRDQNKGWRG